MRPLQQELTLPISNQDPLENFTNSAHHINKILHYFLSHSPDHNLEGGKRCTIGLTNTDQLAA